MRRSANHWKHYVFQLAECLKKLIYTTFTPSFSYAPYTFLNAFAAAVLLVWAYTFIVMLAVE